MFKESYSLGNRVTTSLLYISVNIVRIYTSIYEMIEIICADFPVFIIDDMQMDEKYRE